MKGWAFLAIRAALMSAISLLGAASTQAAVYYVDGNCPSSGSGASVACGTNGPKVTIPEGIALLQGAGDILQIRGLHAPHDGESTSFDGRYGGDRFSIDGKNGATGNPIIIQPYLFGQSGQETVYIEGTGAPGTGATLGWSQCTDCSSAGNCPGVPGVCQEVWRVVPPSLMSLALGAQRPDGTPTYRVESIGALTGQFYSFSSGSTAGTSGQPIFVRWGTGSSAPGGSGNVKPYVFYNNNGVGFVVGETSPTSWITIRGFRIRCHRRQAVAVLSNARNITVDRNIVTYNADVRDNGSDYGMVLYSANNITVSNNEIAFTGSEGLHTEAASSGATVYTITGNWIHQLGDDSVVGPAVVGTPAGMILGDSGGAGGNGDYTGSSVDNNLVENLVSNNPNRAGPKGIILENNSNNWILRNNIIRNPPGECIKLDATRTTVSNNNIYNNLLLGCGKGNVGAGNGAGIVFLSADSTKAVNNNSIYNNTFVDNFGGAIASACSGSCTGNVFRNNIMYDSGSKQLVTWAPTGVFQYNLVYSSSSGTLVGFNGKSLGCSQLVTGADVDGDGVAVDGVMCQIPKFVQASGGDYHLASGSPAIDAGTGTGMPSGRTASINNTLASSHGLPSYADNLPKSGSAWDIGATEFGAGGPPTASISLSDPSPTAAGDVNLTLTTSSTIVQLPGPVVFVESDNTITSITLSGTVPGTVFSGLFRVDSSVADGLGTFTLPVGSLVDAFGNTGNSITAGAQTMIDKIAPPPPINLRFGY